MKHIFPVMRLMKKYAKSITLTSIFLTTFFWQSCIVCLNCDKEEELVDYAYVYVSDTDTSDLFHFSRALEMYSQEERNHLDSILFCNRNIKYREESIESFFLCINNNLCQLAPHDSLYDKGLYDKVLIIYMIDLTKIVFHLKCI